MTRPFYVILFVGFFLSSSWGRAETLTMEGSQKIDGEMDKVIDSVSTIRNPFMSFVPKMPPVVIPPTVDVKTEEPKPTKPSKPPKPPKPVPPSLALNGMVWGDLEPKAIINEKVVSVGDSIEGAKVVSISQKGVQMVFKGVKVNLVVDK